MRIHFIAIGGSAMHNLALALKLAGHEITGSDDEIFDPAKTRLANAGILPDEIGWFPEKLASRPDAVILGMHAKKNNPELLMAQELGLTIYSYPEYLYEAFKDKTRIVIGGSHGKTTITSMILHVFMKKSLGFDYMVGAQLEGFENMVGISLQNKIAVIEGDEYLTSPIDLRPKFHLYKPNIGFISGIAWDHINVFPTFENYLEQFVIFIQKIEPTGCLIYNQEDADVCRAVVKANRNDIDLIPYQTPKFRIEDGKTYVQSKENKEFELRIFGEHNLSNLAGALKVCEKVGISEEDFLNAISDFKGAAKRLELLAESSHSVAYKDFAHSPSKLKATTTAFKNQYPERKLLACMELHTYSSLNKEFLKEYENSMAQADEAIVFYSPHAVELKGLDFIDADFISNSFQHPNIKVMTDEKELEKYLLEYDSSNTNLLLMSSGNWNGMNQKEVAGKFCK